MSRLKMLILSIISVFIIYMIFKLFITSSGGASITEVRYVGEAGGCSEQKPILVTIKNRLPFKINAYQYEITAKRNGFSTDIRNDRHYTDKIVPAFGSDSICWSITQQNNSVNALMNISKYGSFAAAQSEINVKDRKENTSLLWSGKIQKVVWDYGIHYDNY